MATGYDNNLYCPATTAEISKAMAGKDILLCVFTSNGASLLAVAGQQNLTINRSAESIEITTKDGTDGWKDKLPGIKEWSIDIDGLYVIGDESHASLESTFESGGFVCLKVINNKTKKSMFGGLAIITDYSLEAPNDDAVTYSISFDGCGKLTNLSSVTGATTMPASSTKTNG